MFFKKLGKNLFVIVLWTIIIAFLSLMPSSNVPGISINLGIPLDKVAHIMLYAIYTFLIGSYLSGKSVKGIMYFMFVLGLPIFYGILMEVLQYYISPSRFFDMLDIFANIIGSLVGVLLLKVKLKN